MDFHGFLLGFTGFRRVLPNFAQLSIVQPVYMVLLGFTWLLLDFLVSYRILPDFVGLYQVLLDFL